MSGKLEINLSVGKAAVASLELAGGFFFSPAEGGADVDEGKEGKDGADRQESGERGGGWWQRTVQRERRFMMPATSDSRVFDDLVERHPKAKKVLAEGDSWFAYPRKFIIAGPAANIVDQLARRKDLVIYSTASNGDEAVAMLSGEQKFALLKKIRHTHFDYLLFSGGGNDIVGRYDFDFLIRPRPDGGGWLDCINQERLAIKLRQLEGAYLSLCELVGEFSQNKEIKIVTHTYDLAIPDKRGFELFDVVPLGKAWMYPYLVRKEITDPEEQKAIVGHIMGGFREMLIGVQTKYPALISVVDTQGTLGESEWRNEIHPTSVGFKKIAEKIYRGAIV